MPPKDIRSLRAAREQEDSEPVEIRRGQGYIFSTETEAPPVSQPVKSMSEEIKSSLASTSTSGKNIHAGLIEEKVDRRSTKIRTDLIKAYKRRAIDLDTTISELMETVLEDWLKNNSY